MQVTRPLLAPSRPPAASPTAPDFIVRRIGIALAIYEPNLSFFCEQLESLTSQTWTEWTCVVTSDSELATLRTSPRLQPFFTDPRFHWHQNPQRLGHLRNFERAIHACAQERIDAIACCDQDDVWEQDKLCVLATALQRAGPLALVHSDLSLIDAGGRLCGSSTVWQLERRGIGQVSPEHLLVRNVVSGCAMLFDANLARRMPTIPAAAQFHDRWYALVAACHGGVHAVPRPLVRYRQHGTQVVGVQAGPSLATFRPTLRAFRRTTDRTVWARNAVNAWRSYLVLCDFVTQSRLLPARRRSGWRVLLLGLRWLRHDVTLGVIACILAIGSFLALVIRSAPDANPPRAVTP